MIYICEKCGRAYKVDYQPTECESCGCTYIRKADEREIIDIVGSMFLNTEERFLPKEERGDNSE